MILPKKITINETLNELLLQIFTGIDYVTKIALKTNKSIPVVYRQLDTLVSFGMLTKQRTGKKVSYEINWINLSDIVSSILYLDIKRLREVTKAHENETKLVSELRSLIEEVPKELFTSKKALAKQVKSFFSHKEVLQLMQTIFKEIDENKDHADLKKLTFDQTIILFIDTFGMLDKEQMNKILTRKFNKDDNIKNVMKYCRIRYLHNQLYNPRHKFLSILNAE